MRQLTALTILLIIIGMPISKWLSSKPIFREKGVLIKGDPIQMVCPPVQLNDVSGHEIVEKAQFHLHGRVLHVKKYKDAHSDLSPFDVAVGWGPMSDSAVLDELTISQGTRFYFYEYVKPPIPENEIISHSTNIHIVPADRKIASFINSLRVGSLVNFRGVLISAKKDDFRWESSLSRTDTGPGACELLYLSQANLIEGDESYIEDEDRADLRQWYDLLYIWRESLNLHDSQAVRNFNREATRYMRTAFPSHAPTPSPSP